MRGFIDFFERESRTSSKRKGLAKREDTLHASKIFKLSLYKVKFLSGTGVQL
jgi:hypothetical protein